MFNVPQYAPLSTFADMWEAPEEWNSCTVLASGSNKYLGFIRSRLMHHEGPFIYSTDLIVKNHRRRDIICLLDTWARLCKEQGLESAIISLADFGGVTSAIHIISYHHVDQLVFTPPWALPQVLAHILNAASPDAAREISEPPPLSDDVPRTPIKEGELLRQEGFLDVFGATNLQIACPCVFKLTGWAQRLLLAKEVLRAFDVPLNMDAILLKECQERRIGGLLFRAITPLVVTSIFRALWSKSRGVEGDVPVIQQELPEHAMGAVDNSELDRNETGDIDIGAP